MSIPKQILEAAEAGCKEYWQKTEEGKKRFKETGKTYSTGSIAENIANAVWFHLCELRDQSGLTSYWSDENRRYDADAVDVILASDMAALLRAREEIERLNRECISTFLHEQRMVEAQARIKELEAAKQEIAQAKERLSAMEEYATLQRAVQADFRARIKELEAALQTYLSSEFCSETSCPFPGRAMCSNPMHQLARKALKGGGEG